MRDENAGGEVRPLRTAGASAQGTVEYALTVVALLALVTGLAAVWRAGERGVFSDAVRAAASHSLSGTGPVDIALF